jgi:hypothetical protein
MQEPVDGLDDLPLPVVVPPRRSWISGGSGHDGLGVPVPMLLPRLPDEPVVDQVLPRPVPPDPFGPPAGSGLAHLRFPIAEGPRDVGHRPGNPGRIDPPDQQGIGQPAILRS